MATTPIWVPLAVAFLGLGGILLTQYFANRREDVRWSRERDREEAAWAREDAARSYERTQQRLAESYLEVLRIVEREGQWVEATIKNWEMAAEEAELGHGGLVREKVPPEPAVTDRATIAAHLAAFGSDNVRTRYKAWRSIIEDIETEAAVVKLYPDPPHPTYRAEKPVRFVELGVRQALADAIAEELGHR